MIDTNRQISKALDFIEKDFNELQKKKEKISFGVAQQALFFLTNGFIFNYLKISSFYFKEQVLFFIPREEQNLASVFLEKFDKYVELKDMDFFILANKNLSLWKEQDRSLHARCRNVLATNFSFLISPAKADLYSKEIIKMEENLHDLKKLEMELFYPSWFESFNNIFPSSLKKFKKNLIFLSHLLVLREKKVKVLLRQIRQKKTEDFLGLVLLDEKIFHVLHVSNSSLSSLISFLQTVKLRKKNEIISRYNDRRHQIYQEMLKKNKKSWIDSFDPFYKSSRTEKILRSMDEAHYKLKKEEEIMRKLLEEESNKKYENGTEQ